MGGGVIVKLAFFPFIVNLQRKFTSESLISILRTVLTHKLIAARSFWLERLMSFWVFRFLT